MSESFLLPGKSVYELERLRSTVGKFILPFMALVLFALPTFPSEIVNPVFRVLYWASLGAAAAAITSWEIFGLFISRRRSAELSANYHTYPLGDVAAPLVHYMDGCIIASVDELPISKKEFKARIAGLDRA
ncbi:hypothetical protein C8A06_1537 [Microbacteriaceae bacterium MWH-Ta3]|nr:hypothetical protein C8A06_1537 [Microbacteriaceae bacterium MWH-Ta3]